MDAAVAVLLIYAILALILYWIIRLAVRHAIADADRRREGGPSYRASILPRNRAGRRAPEEPAQGD